MKIRCAVLGVMGLALGCTHTQTTTERSEAPEQNEVKMSLDQVPPAVRDTLTKEANGAKIGRVDKEMNDGQTVYETDVMSGGQNWEIRVDQNGHLISKKV